MTTYADINGPIRLLEALEALNSSGKRITRKAWNPEGDSESPVWIRRKFIAPPAPWSSYNELQLVGVIGGDEQPLPWAGLNADDIKATDWYTANQQA